MPTPLLRTALVLIAWLTIVSGAVQVASPALVLGLVGGGVNPEANHFFGIVGMFMVLFGGLAVNALRSAPSAQPLPLRWAGLQKLGAAVAVGLAVYKGLLGPMALGVAGFDLLSGVLIFLYVTRLRTA